MSWPGYTEYKAVSTAYLNEIPSHWQGSRFSRHVAINGGLVDPREEPYRHMTLVAPNHVESGTGKLLDLQTAEEQGADSGKYLVRGGQVIYSKIRPNLVKVVLAPQDCLCSADMYGLEPERQSIRPGFLRYVMLSKPFTDYVVDSSMRVAMPKVNHESLGAAPIWIPPVTEQEAIEHFLGAETAKIDALIGKQEQLIATLREDRTANITHAVTKGLDPDVEMKGSGVEWLGDMPRHWVATRLKHPIESTESGTSVNAGDWPAGAVEVGVLKTSCVSAGWFNPAANKTVVDQFEIDRATCPVKGESLIVNRANTPQLVGSAGYVEADYNNLFLSDKLWQIRFGGASAQFICYWTQTKIYRSQIAALCVGASSSMQNLAMSDFRNIALALPPMDEQLAIVEFLHDLNSKIDGLIKKSTAVIEVLKEYRSALITDAVTGKIDVRGVG